MSQKRGPFDIGIIPLFIKESFQILYDRSKMILLCTWEDSIYSSTSTGSDIILTSNCTYDIIFFHCKSVVNGELSIEKASVNPAKVSSNIA